MFGDYVIFEWNELIKVERGNLYWLQYRESAYGDKYIYYSMQRAGTNYRVGIDYDGNAMDTHYDCDKNVISQEFENGMEVNYESDCKVERFYDEDGAIATDRPSKIVTHEDGRVEEYWSINDEYVSEEDMQRTIQYFARWQADKEVKKLLENE